MLCLEGAMVGIEKIRNAEIFIGLNDEELHLIAPICHEETLPAGTVIWKAGDSADRVYILEEGKAQINLRGKATIDITEAGRILGWSAFVKYNKYYTATAQCLEDSRCCPHHVCQICWHCSGEIRTWGCKVMDNLANVIAPEACQSGRALLSPESTS